MPEVKVKIGDDVPARPATGDTGTAGVVALADRGPTDAPEPIRSTTQLAAKFGPRVAYSPLYDVLDIAFRRGLEVAWVVRVVGPAAVVASNKLVDAEGADALNVLARSPGDWANAIDVDITEGVSGFHVRVSFEDELKEVSPEVTSLEEAISWAGSSSAYITLEALGEAVPKVQSVALAGGADDRNNVDAEVIAKALALLKADLGFMQVAVPGNTAEAVQAAVIAHCFETQRVPILDGEDTDDPDDLIEQVGALRSLTGARQAGLFAPWDIAPDTLPGVTRTIPPCGRQLGAIASTDSQTGNPNQPAAGEEYGRMEYLTGLSQTYSDADRKRLNDAGVNVSIIDEGAVTTYGWRSLANPVTDRKWLPFSNARLTLSMAAKVKRILKRRLFAQLDEQGDTRSKAEGDCGTEVIKPAFAARAIYGATEGEAGRVVVTQDVNPTDGSIGRLDGQLTIHPTGYAEEIEMTVSVTNEAL